MYLDEDYVLCASSAYTKQYFFNDAFSSLPPTIQNELKIMCVLFTEDVGGVLTLRFDEDGSLLLETSQEENDFCYDEIGSVLKIKQIQSEKKELLESLEMFFKVFFLGDDEIY